MDLHAPATEEDEARMLVNRDIEGISSHRTDELRGYSRRHIVRRISTIADVPTASERQDGVLDKVEGKPYLDHTPHALFVEMDELKGEEWVEEARWIKYEEDREEGAERWGKAHISTLTFHSLINLRLCLETGERSYSKLTSTIQ